ncbi:hypothetical protein CL622_00140 [archaeon]|nr:hypothetical protein [archaeon]|tara:strand:+ start:146 stop:331 length:186 start_codon:yes stop_codon:yes gene_type:complete
MRPKFKIGNSVELEFRKKKYIGKIYIIDRRPDGYSYDIMCSKPEKVLIKHVKEDYPKLKKL